ncbi:MAG: class I SAM-dependent methyltransferase [Arcobacter sp.]|uniref:class I SAM-dependent methyltransferase n=1 Tax=Arcobacter sp. TaxID=1872629 RepID=UPI003AFFD7D4
MSNIDNKTVSGFGYQWKTYKQDKLVEEEYDDIFEGYFKIFPFEKLNDDSVGFDLGCGSGRWAEGIAPKVGKLYCIDPSIDALNVAKNKLSHFNNVEFLNNGVDEIKLEDNSMDFGYSLGVLHHIPDTTKGIKNCVDKLKSGGFFLIYLYYSLDNKPFWYKALWKASNIVRMIISKMPNRLKLLVTKVIALLVYLPLARTSLLLEKLGLSVDNFPLSAYRDKSFYTMKTDSFDRFSTRLEHRFSKVEIHEMMGKAGLKDIVFNDAVPYWVAVGRK